ncbi:MAG: GNAT family N-acetyltransferase [Planctomycetaceae bacterium]
MSKASLTIRTATAADEPAAAKLADEVYAALRSIYRPTEMAQSSGHQLQSKLERLVAFDGTELAGTVKFFIEQGSLRVIGLAVGEQHRRRGTARDLIEELIRIARDRGATSLSLYSVPAAGAVPFYERLGFRIVRECEEGYFETPTGEPVPEVFLERSI